jgi:hypothetical protein
MIGPISVKVGRDGNPLLAETGKLDKIIRWKGNVNGLVNLDCL